MSQHVVLHPHPAFTPLRACRAASLYFSSIASLRWSIAPSHIRVGEYMNVVIHLSRRIYETTVEAEPDRDRSARGDLQSAGRQDASARTGASREQRSLCVPHS